MSLLKCTIYMTNEQMYSRCNKILIDNIYVMTWRFLCRQGHLTLNIVVIFDYSSSVNIMKYCNLFPNYLIFRLYAQTDINIIL